MGASAESKLQPLNSVMDDNKVLACTGSAARVPLAANTRIVLVTESAERITPATVSRVGVVCGHEHEASTAAQNKLQPLLVGREVKVKIDYNGDVRRTSAVSLAALQNTVRQQYQLEHAVLKYLDDEDDYVTLQNEMDFEECVKL